MDETTEKKQVSRLKMLEKLLENMKFGSITLEQQLQTMRRCLQA